MRILILAGCALIAALSVAPLSEAAPYRPWCSRDNRSGSVSCAFDTQAQCTQALGGVGGICIENTAPRPVETAAAVADAPDPSATPRNNYRSWCSQTTNGNLTCSYDAQEQCLELIRGLGGVCMKNPAPPPVETPATIAADAAQAAALAASSRSVKTSPDGRESGKDPDAKIRAYMVRDGAGSQNIGQTH